MGNPKVVIDSRERAARTWLPTAALPGDFWEGPDGELVQIQPDGTVEPIVSGGKPYNRSIASSPAAVRAT